MSKKVIYARLQTEAYIPGIGSLGIVLPPQSKSLENLEMTATEYGLSVEFLYAARKTEVLVPYGNIVVMSVMPEKSILKPAKVA